MLVNEEQFEMFMLEDITTSVSINLIAFENLFSVGPLGLSDDEIESIF